MSLRTSIFIDLAGNMSARANQFLGGLQRLGTGGSRSMNVLHRSIQAAGQGLDRLGNRYTALLSGAAGVGTIKQVGDLSMRLTRLGITANITREQTGLLYKKLLDTAQMPDIRVDPGEMLSGVEVIVEKLGDLDLAKDNLRNIGLMMQATGANGEEAGDMIANFREKFNLRSPQEMLQGLDILVKQGKAGSFTLKDLATQGNRVTAAYGAMGRSGIDAVREMGAVLQVFRRSSGSAEEASTAFKNFFSDLMEPSKQKILHKLGVNIWDPAKLKEGKKQIRSAVDIIDELFKKLKGDPEKLARVFGMQSLDGLKAFIAEWQKSGKNAASEFMAVSGDGAELSRDAARAAQEFNAATQNLYTSWKRFASSNFAAPIQKMANYLNSLDPKAVDLWLKVMAYGAGALGGAVLAKKGWDIFSWGRDLFKGKGKSGLPGGLSGSGNTVPVYVVNMPGSIPGLPSAPGGTAGKTGRFGRVLKSLPLAAAGRIVAAGAAGYAVGTVLNSGINSATKWATGGKADSLGALIYDLLHRQKSESPKKAEVGGKIKIEIQQNGQAKVSQLHSNNPSVKFDVSTGLMMAGGY
ncbi:MAG: Phage-related minor tail protein [Syntrophus sp. PtaB.Bin001]|nr:MAG: Phage-related minor tail protein [Syntrophus sp. PtaB.Bin001]